MSILEKLLGDGFASLVQFAAEPAVTDAGDNVQVIIEDAAILPDPDKPAQGKLPVYANLSCVASQVADPRAVKTITCDDGRTFKVLEYKETGELETVATWLCEKKRR